MHRESDRCNRSYPQNVDRSPRRLRQPARPPTPPPHRPRRPRRRRSRGCATRTPTPMQTPRRRRRRRPRAAAAAAARRAPPTQPLLKCSPFKRVSSVFGRSVALLFPESFPPYFPPSPEIPGRRRQLTTLGCARREGSVRQCFSGRYLSL